MKVREEVERLMSAKQKPTEENINIPIQQTKTKSVKTKNLSPNNH